MTKKMLGLLAFLGLSFVAMAQTPYKTSFAIRIKGEESNYTIFSVFVMPGERLTLSSTAPLRLTGPDIGIREETTMAWQLTCPPEPGAYKLTLRHDNGEVATLNVLVLTPITDMEGEYLGKYRIGNYPTTPLRGNPIYLPPKGLFMLTDDLLSLKLTPHFTLKQFQCKQGEDRYPKYLLVRERLLLKLEYLLEVAQEEGYDIETFGFISGYRTPHYNQAIGNVKYSRHVYGGAADIIIDQNRDGNMDDLNQDGKVDENDVRLFYNLVERQVKKERYAAQFIGGLGFYKRNNRHHGFIHVDVRGTAARW